MAGLTAAYELEKLGHTCVILEADRSHIGRRVRMAQQVISKTTDHRELDGYIEQLNQRGAPWITRFKDMACFARGLGLEMVELYSAAQLHDRYRPH